jgi:hypothetical protein
MRAGQVIGFAAMRLSGADYGRLHPSEQRGQNLPLPTWAGV